MIDPLMTLEILLVEDNPGDVRLTQEALQHAKVHTQLWAANDCEHALERLSQTGEFAGRPLPDLILLDINLQGTSGLDMLRTLKEDAVLRRIPVVVLSSSSDPRDVLASYDLHANCYVRKPDDFHQFVEVIGSIERFWFDTVTRASTNDTLSG